MATWIAPQTFVDGDDLSFAELNAAIGAGSDLQWLKEALAKLGITASTGKQSVSSALRGTRVLGTGQEISSGRWTTVAWSTDRFGWSNGQQMSYRTDLRPDVLYLPAVPDVTRFAGYWMIGAHVAFEANVTGQRGVRLSISGSYLANFQTTILASQVVIAAGAGETALSVMTVDGGDSTFGVDNGIFGGTIFICEVYQDSGVPLQINSSPAYSAEFWIRHMGVSS